MDKTNQILFFLRLKKITSLKKTSLDPCMCYVFAKLSHFYYYISSVCMVPYPHINSTEKCFF